VTEHNIDTFNLDLNELHILLGLALQNNYFKFNNCFYKQGNCLAMSNRLAVVAANCFVFKLEKQLFSTLPNKPVFWIRYIDDIFAIINTTSSNENVIINNMKILHPNISFTYNITTLKEGTIFLDTFVSYTYNNLNIGLYRKPTHSNAVLNFYSHHTYATKLGIAIGQFKRIKTICNNVNTIISGNEIIRKTLMNSNYPEKIFEKHILLQI
jgi:hypothetical protein